VELLRRSQVRAIYACDLVLSSSKDGLRTPSRGSTGSPRGWWVWCKRRFGAAGISSAFH